MWNGYRRPAPTAVFISGGGSTLQTLLEIQHQMDIRLVVSGRKSAPGARKAARFGVPVLYLPHPADFASLHGQLRERRIERLVLAGFMRLLPAEFTEAWQGRILNIHPSLLPAFPGLDSAARSWQARDDMGVTIHEVTAEMDAGPRLLQARSSTAEERLELPEAELWLRRTEQHLLREMGTRYF